MVESQAARHSSASVDGCRAVSRPALTFARFALTFARAALTLACSGLSFARFLLLQTASH